ncbi:Transposase, Mutator family [Nitrosomonas marina]|uniref:Mutator family transposase n=1 Tax=Nitrosomonas marina TaxID=917 RepID=A0A1I0G314_9PROT|nr:Transposase, Mutator family [Nitrosomonas marina]
MKVQFWLNDLTKLQSRGVKDILMDNICTLFKYPEDIRKAIYTTNANESLNSVIRKAIKKRKLFPSNDSAKL